MENRNPCYGLIAEWATADALMAAVKTVRSAGYRRVAAYTPFPVDGLPDALGLKDDRVAPAALIGGIVGGVGTWLLQWYSVTIDYPLNVGGRVAYWPGFIPATFEMIVLGAALATFFAMLFLNGLPRLNHPIFNAPEFDLVSRNRFFLCVESVDPLFDLRKTRQFLTQLEPLNIAAVNNEKIE